MLRKRLDHTSAVWQLTIIGALAVIPICICTHVIITKCQCKLDAPFIFWWATLQTLELTFSTWNILISYFLQSQNFAVVILDNVSISSTYPFSLYFPPLPSFTLHPYTIPSLTLSCNFIYCRASYFSLFISTLIFPSIFKVSQIWQEIRDILTTGQQFLWKQLA